MPLIEVRNGSSVEECQAVKVRQRVSDFVVLAVDLTNAVHGHPQILPSASTGFFNPARTANSPDGSFPEHRLHAEPHRSNNPRDEHRNNGLECVTLRLLNALAPAPEVLKIRP